MSSKLLLLNHSSLLISDSGKYILTDPWHLKPAFGSWMPTFQQYINPTYLSALGDNLAIVVSHGHDDHCDDDLLQIFDPSTIFVVPNYKSPSVLNRILRLGFNNVIPLELGECKPLQVHDSLFQVNGFINSENSEDDCVVTIATPSGLVIHANDNWEPMTQSIVQSISNRINQTETQNGYLFTQTNSASGYPLNYNNLSLDKHDLLQKKVKSMIEGGVRNAQMLGLPKIFSYAGYATPYVEGQSYQDMSLFPTPRFIKSNILDVSSVANQFVEDFYPGDILHLATGTIDKAFISSDSYTDYSLKSSTQKYYETYEFMPQYYCSFSSGEPISLAELNWFLTQFGSFVSGKVSKSKSKFSSILGKTFTIEVEDLSISTTLIFGEHPRICVLGENVPSNKHCYVEKSSILKSIFKGETLFESLYTGYLAKWSRSPEEIYNRDIITMIVMFSYYYRNVLAKEYLEKFSG